MDQGGSGQLCTAGQYRTGGCWEPPAISTHLAGDRYLAIQEQGPSAGHQQLLEQRFSDVSGRENHLREGCQV